MYRVECTIHNRTFRHDCDNEQDAINLAEEINSTIGVNVVVSKITTTMITSILARVTQ